MRCAGLVIFCFLIFPFPVLSQADDTARSDSADIYLQIHRFASKRKITYRIYRMVFNEPEKIERHAPAVTATKKYTDPYARYKGRIIRNIEIIVFDPFEKPSGKKSVPASSFVERSANHLHKKSARTTIRNHLLFKKHSKLDPFALKESERLLRQTGTVSSASVLAYPVLNGKDSVDITVIVQDKWSLGASGGLTSSQVDVSIREENILGTGHRVQTRILQSFEGETGVSGTYIVPNIRRSFISTAVVFSNRSGFHYNGVSVSRPFYSPLAAWAGGASFFVLRSSQVFSSSGELLYVSPLKYYDQDLWLAHSFKFLKNGSEAARSNRLIIAARYRLLTYLERAPFSIDTEFKNQDSDFYLAGAGFSNQRYYKEKYIYKLGEEEDVPEGRLLAIIGGYENREVFPRSYAGGRISFGNHIEAIGHLSSTMEYGSFFRSSRPEEGVFSFSISYFSNLSRIGKWSTRQFLDFKMVDALERRSDELLYLGGKEDIYGLRRDIISGQNKMSLNFRSVFFSPFDILGFKVATIGFAGLGMVHNDNENPFDSRIYQVYGIGFLLRNEHLVSSTIRFSVGFYPSPPDSVNWFRWNPLTSYNFGFREFYFSKPDVMSYR